MSAQVLYWEDPGSIATDSARFPQGGASDKFLVTTWQEFEKEGDKAVSVTFFSSVSADGISWEDPVQIGDTLPISGKEASYHSLLVTENNDIYVAVAAEDKSIRIFRAKDSSPLFSPVSVISSEGTLVAPRLFESASGNLLVFVSREDEDSLTLFYAHSPEGEFWSDLLHFNENDEQLILNFLPTHSSLNGRDFIVFQSLLSGERSSYQLYLKTSDDGGLSWTPARWLTNYEEEIPGLETQVDRYDNQRPYLKNNSNKLGLVWERRYGSRSPQIYYSEIDFNGSFLDDPEKITEDIATCANPRVLYYNGKTLLSWFDNRTGENAIYLSEKQRTFWREKKVSSDGSATFSSFIVQNNLAFLIWGRKLNNRSELVLLAPDRSSPVPDVSGVGFTETDRVADSEVRFNWNKPYDSSGIRSYSWSWSQDPEVVPHTTDRKAVRQRSLDVRADNDGLWYFKVRSRDNAGNWSPPSVTTYFRDTTPPGPVDIFPPDLDNRGYVSANTFRMNWSSSESDVAGYSYRMQYLGSGALEQYPLDTYRQPSLAVNISSPDRRFGNIDNGSWVFSVRAIDRTGNAGQAVYYPLQLNKYIPVTYISLVSGGQDDLGMVRLSVRGRGFSDGGEIDNIILDRDRKAPWDYQLNNRSLFDITTDRTIENVVFEDLELGDYYVGVHHPLRGWAFSSRNLAVDTSGTVKFGDYSEDFIARYKSVEIEPFTVDLPLLSLVIICSILFLLLLVSAVKAVSLYRENQSYAMQAHALMNSELMNYHTKKRKKAMAQSGSLRVKFTISILSVVITIILLVSIPLAEFMVNSQKETLVNGLKQRSELILRSMSKGAESYLPDNLTVELGSLPKQIEAMDEAISATITGHGLSDAEGRNYIWGTNDSEISDYDPGRTRLNDELDEVLAGLESAINAEAVAELGEKAAEYDKMADQIRALIGKTDEESRNLYQEMIITRNELGAIILEIISTLDNQVFSTPEFVPGESHFISLFDPVINRFRPDWKVQFLQEEYLFYKPLVYKERGSESYYQGAIRLRISTDKIIREIENSQKELLIRTGIIALLGIFLGLLGSLFLSAITIRPIKKLVKGIEILRDTEDFAQFGSDDNEKPDFKLKSKDELSILGNTLDDMTNGLIEAAKNSQELILGKEIQKKFIPLDEIDSKTKKTYGSREFQHINYYGYYEGAKSVSGDYFDVLELDDRYYAMIKCDVAGKGVQASLIMVQVATMFLNYFSGWKERKISLNLTDLISSLNNLLAERNFVGKFAALIVVLLDSKTGACYCSNAGDTEVHIYNNAEKKMKVHKLPQAPATGVFDNFMIEMQGLSFKQVKLQLNPGDVLFLFTDGIEEAKRMYRDGNFDQCKLRITKDDKENETYDFVPLSDPDALDGEEFSMGKVHDIIEQSMNRGRFSMKRHLDPEGDDRSLEFDYSSCTGTQEEAVFALVAAEKVYRAYLKPGVSADDTLQMDKKVDEFLEKTFAQYELYYGNPMPVNKELDAMGYTRFNHVNEDSQFDDLTIMTISLKK